MLMLPTFNAPAYSYTIALEGRDYVLRFVYSERCGDWHLSIFDADESPIVTGIRVVSNFPLLHRLNDARLPPGMLIALDMGRVAKDPGLEDFGARVRLAYLSAEDIAAALAVCAEDTTTTFEDVTP